VKRYLAKKARENRPIPQWFRMRTNNKIKWVQRRGLWNA